MRMRLKLFYHFDATLPFELDKKVLATLDSLFVKKYNEALEHDVESPEVAAAFEIQVED